jgi:hypothetical protein
MRLCFELSLAAVLFLPMGAKAYTEATFGDWWVICDPQRHCTAFGFGRAGADSGFIRIERSGEPNDQPYVVIAVPVEEAGNSVQRASVTFSVLGDGLMHRRTLSAERDPELSANAFQHFYADASSTSVRAALVPALIAGRELVLSAPRLAQGWVSLDGSAAALRWMDVQQKRAGTVTALTAVGTAPASSIPKPLHSPLIRRAKAVSQDRLPKQLPPPLAKELGCFQTAPDVEVHRLTPSLLLWGASCGGMYNVSMELRIADVSGGNARQLQLRAPDSEYISSAVTTGGYDPESRQLSEFYRGRGLGDCGVANTWTWDGRRLVHTSSLVMAYCRGVPVTYWARGLELPVR